MGNIYLGIDIGGTNTKLGLVDGNARILETVSLPTEPEKGPRDLFLRVIRQARLFGKKFEAAGAGIAGLVNFEKKTVLFCPNLGWKNVDVKKELSALGGQIYVDNDANCSAWGSYLTSGAARGVRHMLVFTLGTGIGGGIIIDGRIYRGARGYAGEFGHIKISGSGRLCNCGSRGCLEAYAGAEGIVRSARAAVRAGRLRLYGARLTPEAVYKAASQKNRAAADVLEKTGRLIGRAVADCANIMDPELVVLTGGISRAGSMILDPVREEVKARAICPPEVILSRDANALGLTGAALLYRSFRR